MVQVQGVLHLAHFFFPLKRTVNIAMGAGDRQRNGIIREALQILLSDDSLWQFREGYVTPNLHPSTDPITHCINLFQVAGTLIMLHFLWIGAPLPITPFLPLLLLDRQASFNYDKSFINRHVSTSVTKGSRQWQSSSLDVIVPQLYFDPVSSLFLDANINPSTLSSNRVVTAHTAVTRGLLMSRTLGTAHPHLELDFAAIAQGANVPLDAHIDIAQHAFLPSDNGPLHTYRSLKPILIQTYNRRVQTPCDLTSRIMFTQHMYGAPRGRNDGEINDKDPFQKAF
ncbi:hypothetical protein BC835DRAFT_1419206 [Cytidiella melzeri]|nr:hypothetical protein BC835DRAFT_1419206 [Cytidiella melzeri]